MCPETIWAVRSAPDGYKRTFYSTRQVILGARFVPLSEGRPRGLGRYWGRFIHKVREHFDEYPGALTLVEMSAIEKELADEYDKRSGGRDRVIFSWRRLPGVLD